MKVTKKQVEYLVELCKIAGLGVVSAFSAEWMFAGGALWRDILGIAFGITLLGVGFALTRRLGDDSL